MSVPSLTRKELLAHCWTIAEEYGGNLTARQLYYQLVARGLLENGQKFYKRVKAVDRAQQAQMDYNATEEGLERPWELEEAVILYFGDHDPDGWEIPRSALRNIGQLQEASEVDERADEVYLPPVRLVRVALNMDQIREFSPPPMPAKVTSARYDGYVAEHLTREAWELDALRPDVLQGLIRESVEALWDEDIHRENLSLLQRRRHEMKERMREPGWLKRALG